MLDTVQKKHGVFIAAILLALMVHSLIFLIPTARSPKFIDLGDRVRIKIIREKSIVEARLPETLPPTQEAFLGAQNHRTSKETRLPNSQHTKAADASSLASGDVETPKMKGYGGLLPSGSEIAAFNDFIPDESIPTSNVLDVNTTEYRYLGYVTAIRKNVDLAFYSPMSSLKDEPHIREKIQQGSKIRYSGLTVAQMTIERSGLLSKVEIVQSGGDPHIDKAWSKILNLAAPFPPLPRHFPQETFVINYGLYYDFVLRGNERIRRYSYH